MMKNILTTLLDKIVSFLDTIKIKVDAWTKSLDE